MLNKILGLLNAPKKKLIPVNPRQSSANPAAEPTVADFAIPDVITTDIKKHIGQVEQMLKITAPAIHIVPYIIPTHDAVMIVKDLGRLDDNTIQNAVGMNEGYYDTSKDGSPIIIARYNSTSDPLPEVEILFTILHELRHVYQLKWERSKYEHNAVGYETITDISEVDADAFAMTYMEHMTPYSFEDYRCKLKDYLLHDGGKREHRKKQLERKYFL